MKCFYCKNTIPDNSSECDICGAIQETKVVPPIPETGEDIKESKREIFLFKLQDMLTRVVSIIMFVVLCGGVSLWYGIYSYNLIKTGGKNALINWLVYDRAGLGILIMMGCSYVMYIMTTEKRHEFIYKFNMLLPFIFLIGYILCWFLELLGI